MLNGIAFNEISTSATLTVTGNTVTTKNNGVGLLLWSVDNNPTISGNTFTGTGTGDFGVYAWDGTASTPMNVTIAGRPRSPATAPACG